MMYNRNRFQDMLPKFIILFFISTIASIGLHGDEPILVGCAANFRLAMSKIISKFESKYTGGRVKVVYASSGKLAAQIIHGAPYDLFLAADLERPKRILQAGYASSKILTYAIGSLVIFNHKGFSTNNWEMLLEDPTTRFIGIANPNLAPYGQAALETMKRLKLYSKIESKIIHGENIMQTAHLALRATDLAFLSKSSLKTLALQPYDLEGIYWLPVSPTLHKPIMQGMLLLKLGSKKKLAQSFFEFMTSDEVTRILGETGYLVPNKTDYELNPDGI